MNKLKLSLLLTLAALAGCRREQPPTVVPPSPFIEQFAASASSVASGTPVTLSWKTANATSVELREASAGALNVPVDQFEGSLEVRPTSSSLYVLVVRGPTGNDTRAVALTVEGTNPTPTFQALPSSIPGGDSTTLVWVAPGARQVELKAGTQSLDVQGQRTAGAVTVRPLEDTDYSLTVDGQVFTAQVAVNAAVLRFASDRLAVEAGDSLSLSWDSAGATRVVLSAEGRGEIFDSTTPATVRSGSFTDAAPSLPDGAVLTYTLTVEKGTERMSKSLEVYVGVGVSIVRLDSNLIATQGGVYTLRWTTLAADKVEVRIDGATAFLTANAAQALSGNVTLLTPPDDFTVDVIATNVRGGRAIRSTQVDVVGVPSSISASASPTTVSAGSSTTLSWSSAEARHLRITDQEGQAVYAVSGQVAESGSVAVFPNRASTTYTLSADNGLGSTPVSTTVTVTVTGSLLDVSAFPPMAPAGGRITLTPSESDTLLVGFPHPQVLVGAHADFVDISTTGQQLDMSTGVRAVPVNFTTWLWGQQQTGNLVVSKAGWMAWNAPLQSIATGAYNLPDSELAPRFMIAPFWHRLIMAADSAVYLQVMGTAPHEKLIVQWTSMQIVNEPNTSFTFEVQLEQTGALSFHYRTVELGTGTALYEIGVQDGTRQVAVTPSFVPVSDSALYFFGPVTSADVQVQRGTQWGGFVQKNGVSTLVSRDAKVVAMPVDLSFTEAMLRPSAAVDAGQYVELINRTTAPVELTGWFLSAGGSRFSFPDGFTLQPDQPFVLGASDVPEENDDAGVQLSWADAGFVLPSGATTLSLGSGATTYNLALSASPAGTATVIDPGPFRIGNDETQRLVTCSASTPFGGQAPQQLGNPGVHGGCGFGYRVVPIAEHYVDVSDGGTALLGSPGAIVDARTVPITLAPQVSDPAPLVFGNRAPVVSMSVDGWLSLESITTVLALNKTEPGYSVAPRGLIAPFWDDLQTVRFVTPESDLYWKRMAAGEDVLRPEPHWIFQWSGLSHRTFTPADSDQLNFEVKLFEDGTIEYHYGELRSGSFSQWANGNSATVWLEKATTGTALTLSAESPVVKPHTAWRFIPQ